MSKTVIMKYFLCSQYGTVILLYILVSRLNEQWRVYMRILEGECV